MSPQPSNLSPVALAACLALTLSCAPLNALAQDAQADTPELPAMGVSASIVKRNAKASVAELGDVPAWQTPAQAQTFGADTAARTAALTATYATTAAPSAPTARIVVLHDPSWSRASRSRGRDGGTSRRGPCPLLLPPPRPPLVVRPQGGKRPPSRRFRPPPCRCTTSRHR